MRGKKAKAVHRILKIWHAQGYHKKEDGKSRKQRKREAIMYVESRRANNV